MSDVQTTYTIRDGAAVVTTTPNAKTAAFLSERGFQVTAETRGVSR